MRSVVLFLSVDVEVAGPGPCRVSKDGLFDLKTFLYIRFISLMINLKVKEKDCSIT